MLAPGPQLLQRLTLRWHKEKVWTAKPYFPLHWPSLLHNPPTHQLKTNKSFLLSPFLLLTYDQQEQLHILLFAIKLIFDKQRSPCADRHSALNARHAQTVTGSPTDLIVDTWTPGSQWLCPTAADWRFTFQRNGYWWPAKGIAASSISWEFQFIDGIICMNGRFCIVFSHTQTSYSMLFFFQAHKCVIAIWHTKSFWHQFSLHPITLQATLTPDPTEQSPKQKTPPKSLILLPHPSQCNTRRYSAGSVHVNGLNIVAEHITLQR